MRIQHNIMAMNSYRNYTGNVNALSSNLEKLSSGYRINRAGDDAAGLAISEKMRAQITGLDAAQKNVQDGISLVKTAEGALQEVQDMMNRMTYLATQSANGTYQDEVDREALQAEVEALSAEIDRIADSANFNGQKLLDGSLGGGAVNSTGAVFSGANIATSEAAKMEAANAAKVDLSSKIDTSKVSEEYLRIDGQTITIDWENDAEAKKLAAQLDANHANTSTEGFEDIAAKLESVINNSAKAQGVNASVSVTVDSNGKFTIKSDNKGVDSEVSYLGNNGAAAADITSGVLTNVMGGGDGLAIEEKATLKYDGKTYDGTANLDEQFQMVINGQAVDVKFAITAGDEMDDTLAGNLETAIGDAVDAYNAALGLSDDTEDPKSGLTGLNKDDFTVSIGDNGNFKVEYTGDLDINFSFRDVGDREVAANLGLANGSSRSGGAAGLTLQIGDSSDSFNQLNVSIDDMHVRSLGIGSIDISSLQGAQDAIETIKTAINKVSSQRGDLGAIQNRLEHTANNLSVMEENITNAESAIRDTDVADEMMSYTKNNILIQSAQAMLAQANQVPQGVLQLLQ